MIILLITIRFRRSIHGRKTIVLAFAGKFKKIVKLYSNVPIINKTTCITGFSAI